MVIRAMCASSLTLAVALAALPAQAGVLPAGLCKDTKMKASGTYHLGVMKAFGRNTKVTNVGRLASDLSKAQSKITKGFTKAEWTGSGVSRECQTTENVASLRGLLDTQANNVIEMFDQNPVPLCTAFPATGQTTCWDSAGTVIACAGTGHDGDKQAGATLSYTDNGDGTITDDNTGLMWEKKSDDGTIHDRDLVRDWAQAFSLHIAGLNDGGGFAGYTDWRLPNVKELQSIVNYVYVFPSGIHPAFDTDCVAGCTVTTCSCTLLSGYWSSTSNAQFPQFAWAVGVHDGNLGNTTKLNFAAVRAVRGGS